MFSNVFFRKKRYRLWENVEKCNGAGEAKDNMAHAHFTLGTSGYKLRVSEYVVVIEFIPEQWLHKRALTLRYTYITFLFIS